MRTKRELVWWVVLVGMLIVGLNAGPDLWAAPGHSPGRQGTVPTRTPRPTKKPSNPGPKPAPTVTPQPANTPVATVRVVPTTTTLPTKRPTRATPVLDFKTKTSPTPTVATVTAASTASVSSPTPTLSTPTASPLPEDVPSLDPSPPPVTRPGLRINTSLVYLGAVGVTLGLIMLVVWARRA